MEVILNVLYMIFYFRSDFISPTYDKSCIKRLGLKKVWKRVFYGWPTEWVLNACGWIIVFVFQSFSSTAWDLSTWALAMTSLSITPPKSNFPGSASQRATRFMPSFVTRRPRPTPRTRKMASCSSRIDSSVWLIISPHHPPHSPSPLYPKVPLLFLSCQRSSPPLRPVREDFRQTLLFAFRWKTWNGFQASPQRTCAIRAVL